MKDTPKRWKPYCCTAKDKVFCNFSRCRPSKSEFSKNVAPSPSFRRISFSDLSRSSSLRISEDIAQTFGPDLCDFKMSELRAITQNFSSNFLLGEGGFGKVHKGYVDENMRPGLKAQPIAVKLLDIEGLQGHREWLVSSVYITISTFQSFRFVPFQEYISKKSKTLSMILPLKNRHGFYSTAYATEFLFDK